MRHHWRYVREDRTSLQEEHPQEAWPPAMRYDEDIAADDKMGIPLPLLGPWSNLHLLLLLLPIVAYIAGNKQPMQPDWPGIQHFGAAAAR